MDKNRTIIKADGTVEPFKWDKFERSLARSHASDFLVEKLKSKLDRTLPEMVSTDNLRTKVHSYLRKHQPYSAARYGIREALMKLGPSGYGFEHFISQIFNTLGYHTNVGAIMQGKCVSHEIDVMASKDDSVDLMECKFHNTFGVKSDVKVALYVHSRFLDLREAWDQNGVQGKVFGYGWLVTNTKLTDDAYAFAVCRGVKVLSWNQPDENSLRQLIATTRLIPITALHSLSSMQHEILINMGIVTCQQLLKADPEMLKSLNKDKVQDACNESVNLIDS